MSDRVNPDQMLQNFAQVLTVNTVCYSVVQSMYTCSLCNFFFKVECVVNLIIEYADFVSYYTTTSL